MDQAIRKVFVIRVHHNMAYAISTQNVEITAFNFDQAPVVLTPENINNNLKSLPRLVNNRTPLDNFLDIFRLYRSIHAVKPDIVHVNALQDLLSAFFAVQLCALQGHKPAIVAMSRKQPTWAKPKRAWLYAEIVKFSCDGFIALSTVHKNQLLQLGIPAEKLTVIPNPFDPAYVGSNHPSYFEKPNEIRRFIYVAHISAHKAQDVLIHAAACVIKKYPEVKFELVGKVLTGEEAYAEELHSLIKQYGLEQSIHFTGGIPYEDVLTSLQKCDAFVFPTRSEMMPRAVIEAMVLGKPVIASAVDGILDLIQNRKTGILVQPGNSTELADAICEFIGNPALANAIGLAGQNYIMEFCSPQKVGRQFCDFYQWIRSKR